MEDIMKLDLYEIIGADPSSTVQEIKKAYRKKALSCHPDKNPDNPRAAELFQELSRVLEILTDVSARAAYDKVVQARKAAKLRVKEYDVKRKKFKDSLEAREEAYRNSLRPEFNVKTDEERLKAEIERLRKEGSKQVEEEIEIVKQKIRAELYNLHENSSLNQTCYRIKIKWRAAKNDPENGGYDYETLNRILSKYGDMSILVVSSAKKGRAMVEFKTLSSADTAAQIEIGLAKNPLTLERLWVKDDQKQTTQSNQKPSRPTANLLPAFAADSYERENKPCTFTSFPSAPDIFQSQRNVTDAQFETMVLTNLKRAEERKRLLEQLEKEQET